MAKHFHIVSFDAPSPPHYGGAVDVYYKILALAEAGVAITLHYFQYKAHRGHQGLERYCKKIYSYDRKPYINCSFSPLPFIVASRINHELIKTLNEDDHPVLLEGIHCTGILPYIQHQKRKVMLRLHNNEAAYYARLSATEKHPLRNLYYTIESNRLNRYQYKLPRHICTAALAESDAAYFMHQLGWTDLSVVPAFTPWQQVLAPSGVGGYCLYHGNLAVSENEAVVLWLLKHVFKKGLARFVVAGSGASPVLQSAIAQRRNVQLVRDPSETEIEQLIEQAQIHLLPSLNETGVKIKLLHALFCGRHCITNKAGVAGSGLEEAVTIAEDAATMQDAIERLMTTPFTAQQKEQRQALLRIYDNGENAEKLIERLYSSCQ